MFNICVAMRGRYNENGKIVQVLFPRWGGKQTH